MNAEDAYVFRHALLRDAAYQLQLPGDRARLHAAAFQVLEDGAGGRAPAAEPLDTAPPRCPPHPTSAIAEELAGHARLAVPPGGDDGGAWGKLRSLYLRRAAHHAEERGEPAAAARLWKEFAGTVAGRESAEALRAAGICLSAMGRLEPALETLEEALRLHRAAGPGKFEGATLTNMATVLSDLGRIAAAESLLRQSRAILRDAGDPHLEATALGSLAAVYWNSGRVEEARAAYEEALVLHRRTGARRHEGSTLANLGSLLIMDDPGRAEQLLGEALRIHRETGNRRFEGACLGYIAYLRARAYRDAEAEALYLETLGILREVQDRQTEGRMLGNLAQLHSEMGRSAEAVEEYGRAIAILRESGNRRWLGAHLCGLAIVHVRRGCREEAPAPWEEGRRILHEAGDEAERARLEGDMKTACAEAGVVELA